MTQEEIQRITRAVQVHLWGKDLASTQVLAEAIVMAIDEYDKQQKRRHE